ncbi:TIGR03364 family FAD-dependent oxidoreductase [Galactobacter valiniphilus]|uniref:TIGR03364 family FAD-dependent oxidoreductase n=1 Tax=Galactobacter valiniphilus TaxID=2676122 RepID=UPI003735B510
MNSTTTPDLIVVGAGIVGLAHAAEALRRGLTVTLLERDHRAVGASVRNFGHVCATAQSGRGLEYALVARERWIELGAAAGIDVRQVGTLVLARHEDEARVLREFAATRPAGQVRLLDADEARELTAQPLPGLLAAAHLPLDLRVDPRAAIPALAAWIAQQPGAEVRFDTHVTAITPAADGSSVIVSTNRGEFTGARVVHAVGHDVDRLFPALAEEIELTRCRLQMLEVAPPVDEDLGPAFLTGLSMLRYGGLAATPAARDVKERIQASTPELLEIAMNLMLTQRPEGSLVLGDTHVDEDSTSPFDDERLAELLLREAKELFGQDLEVRRRWRGVYAHSAATDFLIASPHPAVRVVSVTSGIGMTTSLGLAPDVLDGLTWPAETTQPGLKEMHDDAAHAPVAALA